MDQFTRCIIGFGVHAGIVDGPALCRMFNAAISGHNASRYLSSDNDPLFKFHRWKANLRILAIDEVKTVPLVPLSHPFVERLIGTVRRYYLDHAPFWNATDLQRKLCDFQNYYNSHRVHYSLNGVPPARISGESRPRIVRLANYRWTPHCRGLYQLPVAA